jgi:hypothetical protein
MNPELLDDVDGPVGVDREQSSEVANADISRLCVR